MESISHLHSEQPLSWAHDTAALIKSRHHACASAPLARRVLGFLSGAAAGVLPKTRRLLSEPLVTELAPFRVPPTTFGTAERAAFEPTLVKLNRIGFDMRGIRCHALQRPLTGETMHRVTVGHSSGTVTARVQRTLRQGFPANRMERHLAVTLFTQLSDGSYVVTTTGDCDFTYPQGWKVTSSPESGILELWEHHRSTVLKTDLDGLEIVTAPGSVPHCPEAFHAAAIRGAVECGTVAPSTLPRDFLPVPPPPTGIRARRNTRQISVAPEDARSVLGQENVGGRRHFGWPALIVTASLFAAATSGWGLATPTNLPLLAGLLFLALLAKDIGHCIAMKLTGFRDPRPLVFPLVASVPDPGHERVAAWRKTVVALAGPLPGLLVGATMSALMHLGLLDQGFTALAAVLLITNGIAMLPFTPLGGGWAMHYAFGYRRSSFAEITAAAVVSAGAVWAAIQTGTLATTIAAAVMLLFCLPAVYRSFRTSGSLRGNPAGKSGTIAPEDVAEILSETRSPFAARLKTRHLAAGIAWVCGRAQSRPLSDPSLVGFCIALPAAVLLALAALAFTVGNTPAKTQAGTAISTVLSPPQEQPVRVDAPVAPSTASQREGGYTQPRVVTRN